MEAPRVSERRDFSGGPPIPLDPSGGPCGPPNPLDRILAARVFREEAERAGFARVGIAPAGPSPRFERYRRWIGEGRHAGMKYLETTMETRADPRSLLPGARSVVCLAAPHRAEARVAPDGSRIARYAAGGDYHWSLKERAADVAERSVARIGPFRYRLCVDSAPVAERSLAAAAGIGWIGKNGCLLDEEHGSFLLLAEILTDLDLPPDEPAAEQCGSCVRCLTSCPTEAFLEPGLLDARRCIAYWTIEHRGPIPEEIKPAVAEHVFGCDICQEVCPWNAPLLSLASRAPDARAPARHEWLEMGPGVWRRGWGATALNRAGRRGVQRNAALSAGACGDRSALPALRRAAAVAERGLSDAASWAIRLLDAGTP